MDKSQLTLTHDVDCLRNELARLDDQEARIHREKKRVLGELLAARRQLLLLDIASR